MFDGIYEQSLTSGQKLRNISQGTRDLEVTVPVMTTISGRPAKVVHLHSIDGTHVQCKLPNGDEAYVPLQELAALIGKQIAENAGMDERRKERGL